MSSNYLNIPPVIAVTAGVSDVNGLSGAVTLAGGTGITLTPVGNTITIAATGAANPLAYNTPLQGRNAANNANLTLVKSGVSPYSTNSVVIGATTQAATYVATPILAARDRIIMISNDELSSYSAIDISTDPTMMKINADATLALQLNGSSVNLTCAALQLGAVETLTYAAGMATLKTSTGGSIKVGNADGSSIRVADTYVDIQAKSDSTGAVQIEGATIELYGDGATMTNQLNFWDVAQAKSVGVKAPAAVTTTYTLTLPLTPGMAGQKLTTDGAGNLYWS